MLRTVLGVMSGTSLDGIDISVVKTNGFKLVTTEVNFTDKYSLKSENLLKIFFKNKNILLKDREFISKLELSITNDFLKAIIKGIKLSESKVEIIGFHGQTIFHSSILKQSIQLGNAQKIADETKIKVIHDFRKNDLFNGGEGAPLAPIYHKYLIQKFNISLPCCFINIGGIANVTYYNKNNKEEILLGFDTGPGNVLMNDYVSKKLGQEYDYDGRIASQGSIDMNTVNNFLKNDFFHRGFPKSADRFDFHYLFEDRFFKHLEINDGLATLSYITAKTISDSLFNLPKKTKNIIISGGGQYNKFLIKNIKKLATTNLILADELNIKGDFIEAELIAYLSMRTIKKLPITFPETTGTKQPSTGGIISLPQNNLF
ncbi:anhydro-N-acetylmuramic acid kinase [Alphaproteobacteria bacterium]|nr:anhydro-N-acetylmuramic acid kinase [Alphaproteobacteria bacterium]